MKLLDRLIYDILYKILYVFLLILLFPVLSRVTKWDYPRLIERFSAKDWILFYILILFSVVLIFYHRRKAEVDKKNIDRRVNDFRIPTLGGEEEIGLLEYKNIFWSLLIPKELPFFNPFASEPSARERLLKLDPEKIELEYWPLCPECGTRIEESDTFFGRYLWKCKKCDFKKKNRHSYYDEGKKATLKAREEFKKFMKGMETKNFLIYKKYLDKE